MSGCVVSLFGSGAVAVLDELGFSVVGSEASIAASVSVMGSWDGSGVVWLGVRDMMATGRKHKTKPKREFLKRRQWRNLTSSTLLLAMIDARDVNHSVVYGDTGFGAGHMIAVKLPFKHGVLFSYVCCIE